LQGRGAQLELVDVSVQLDGRPVLRRVNLRVPAASYLVILGPSGSGKTTLLRAIAGLVPAEGRILIGGRDYGSRPPWERPVAMVQQIPGLLPHLSILENVALAARVRGGLSGREALEEARRLLERLGISEVAERRPGEVSGGQLQRAALAAALAARPSILLLDEPLSHLDRPLAEQLRRMLRGVQRDYGVTVVHVTHDQDEALALATHLALLRDGEIVDYGEAPHLYFRPHRPEAARFLGHNLLPGELLGLEPGLASFPPEAVELGEGPYTGVVRGVELERGRAIVYLDFRGYTVKAYTHPLQAAKVRAGVRVRFKLAEELVQVYQD
jgi:ABC-type Fe3+/spermidine/putrescine transport system ATPase subunit